MILDEVLPIVNGVLRRLGNERLTGAVLDRLTHRCHILEMNGESYRLKDAKRRRHGRTLLPPTEPPPSEK